MTQSKREPDLCIIGAGGAGFEAAMVGAALGLAVTVIERDTGDESLRNGDLALEVLRSAALTAVPTMFAPGRAVDFARFHERLTAALHEGAADRRLARLGGMNVQIIREAARFADARTIMAGGHMLRPWRTIIATGSVDAPRDLGAWLKVQRLTLERLDTLGAYPRHLAVIGSDGRALAIAQAFRRLGAAVTLLHEDELLPGVDCELVEPVLRMLRREGVSIVPLASEEVRSLAAASEWSHLIVAGRRIPALVDLDLARSRIDATAGGLILSKTFRTSNPRVYAIGDATGAASMAAAQAQIGIVFRAAFFRAPPSGRATPVSFVVDTDPQIATVGLSEAEALARGPVAITRWPFAETDAGRAAGDAPGHVKVIADRQGRILGTGIVGHGARDAIAFWALAVARGLTLGDLSAVPLPRPSLAEASRRAAMVHAAKRLGNPWLRRVLALMRRFD